MASSTVFGKLSCREGSTNKSAALYTSERNRIIVDGSKMQPRGTGIYFGRTGPQRYKGEPIDLFGATGKSFEQQREALAAIVDDLSQEEDDAGILRDPQYISCAGSITRRKLSHINSVWDHVRLQSCDKVLRVNFAASHRLGVTTPNALRFNPVNALRLRSHRARDKSRSTVEPNCGHAPHDPLKRPHPSS